MGTEQKDSGWRRLDNTAKIFPVIANENLSNVFRISVTLKKEVRPMLLQAALEEVLTQTHNFRVKLRRGVFWYYFEENKKIPQVRRESTYPCRYIDPHGNRRFLFRVTYFGRRINLEVFHALTDGLGAVNFLKELTVRYLQMVRGEQTSGQPEEEAGETGRQFNVEDSYLKNYREVEQRSYSSRPAYQLAGNYLPLGTGQVLHGYVKVAELKAAGARYGASITKYLATVLIWTIWKEYLGGKPCDKPVALNLPINLRAFFGSETMANFFAVTTIGWLFRNPEMDFDTLVQKVSHQMDKKIDKERLEESISYNVSNEKKWYLRITPLVLKWAALNIVFLIKDRAYTTTLSNVGPIQMDPEYQDEVERFHLMIGVSRRQPMKCAVCAYQGESVITFTSVFADSRLQKAFFRKLREDGISVRLEGNGLSSAKKKDMYPSLRRVLIRRQGGEAKASRIVKNVEQKGGHAVENVRDYITGDQNLKDELSRRFHL